MDKVVKGYEVQRMAYKRLKAELEKEPINTVTVSALTDVIRTLSVAPEGL